MGEYPKRSEIKAQTDDNPYGGSIVEIKQNPRYQQLTRLTLPESPEWYDNKEDYPFRIDEDGNNIVIGYVTEILTHQETHPYGIMVKVDHADVGRVQRILVGEEVELHTARLGDKSRKHLASMMTDRDEELLQKFDHKSKLFPKSEIPPSENDKNEFKASFKTPTKSLAISDSKNGDAVVRKGSENKGNDLKRMVSNTVVALANSEGGRLFIGIDDKTGKVIGSKSEPAMELKTNEKYDRYKRAIQDSIFEFTKMRPDNITFQKGEDEEFLVLHVERGTESTMIHEKNKELYYIRLDGESVPCYGGDMIRHMKKRFPNELSSNRNDTAGSWNQNRRHYRR